MEGILYGVGVGPGDPELLTLKAVRVLQQCEVLAVPGAKKEETVAYQIARQAVPEIAQKPCLAIEMPMTKQKDLLEKSHQAGAEQILTCMRQGKQIAFLTLGDPTVYSTYLYLHERIVQAGGRAEIISGIPSFCAVAAKLGIGLVEKHEMLHIIPSSYQIGEALELSGTKVLMKAGRKLPEVKALLQKKSCTAAMIENCGMEEEKVYPSLEEIDAHAGYYSLVVVKDKEEKNIDATDKE